MRFTTVSVALFFLSTVIASPIYPLREGDSVALRKRVDGPKPATPKPAASTPRRQGSTSKSPTSSAGTPRRQSSTGRTTPSRANSKSEPGAKNAHCKRATESEVISALQALEKEPLGAGEYGSVHPLKAKLDGHDAIVKIIKGSKMKKADIEHEVKNARQVKQFIAWAHSATTDTYYIIMPNMGISEKDAKAKGMTEDPKVLTKAAEERYKTEYHMVHGDIDAGGKSGGNVVYKMGSSNKYEAEIIDWGMASLDPTVDPAKVGYSAALPAAAEIKDDHCVYGGPSPSGSQKSGGSGWD